MPSPRLVSLPDGKPLPILPPSVALNEALCDLREKRPADQAFAAGSAIDLVVRHCLDVEGMAFVGNLQEDGTIKGGPTRWPGIVLSIIATWPDDGPGPWNRWRAFVASCVAVYAEPWRAMREATLRLLDPASAREDAEQEGIEDAEAWLSGAEPKPSPIEPPADDSKPTKAPDSPKRERRYKRGERDAVAVAELARNPSLTNTQLAEMLGCNRTTLASAEKTPMLAKAREAIKSSKLDYARGDEWRDRRADD